MSFPRELNYNNNKPIAEDGVPSIVRFSSDNQKYTENQEIVIEIPCGSGGNQYLFQKDSVLEGIVKVSGTISGTIAFDQSVYSLFSEMTIVHASKTIEYTQDCNKLWTAIYDLQVNASERQGDTITKLVGDTNNTFNHGFNGRILDDATDVISDTVEYRFSFVIPSGFVGSLAQKALPLALMSNSSLYIRLKLAPSLVVFTSPNDVATNLSYSVSDIYYNAKITTLPNDVNNRLLQTILSNGVVNLPAVCYKTEKKGLASGSTIFNDKFGYQFSSIKNFLFWFQNQNTANGTTLSSRSVSARSKANMKNFYLTINGLQYPSQPVEGYNNMYANLLRAYDSLQVSFD